MNWLKKLLRQSNTLSLMLGSSALTSTQLWRSHVRRADGLQFDRSSRHSRNMDQDNQSEEWCSRQSAGSGLQELGDEGVDKAHEECQASAEEDVHPRWFDSLRRSYWRHMVQRRST